MIGMTTGIDAPGLSAPGLSPTDPRAPRAVPQPSLPPGMPLLRQGRYLARYAQGPEDVDAAQALRHRCFFGEGQAAPRPDGRDRDDLDEACLHLLVEETEPGDADGGALVACCRLIPYADGRGALQGYAARHYDLSALSAFPAPVAEIGRFCVRPGLRDGTVLRVAWRALARFITTERMALLFGCSSFPGTDAAPYLDALALLRDRHVGPDAWRPGIGAPEVLRFADLPAGADAGQGAAQVPPLLRSYLAMGGWVTDHAVIDREMNTLHVFTGIEVAAIPPARARALGTPLGLAPIPHPNGP